MGLDFCPFETEGSTGKFARIDMSNLAYELIFRNGYTKTDFRGTVLESSHYLDAKTDERLNRDYQDSSEKMILEEEIPGKHGNQLRELLERLDEEKQNETLPGGGETRSADAMEDMEETEGGETGILLDYQLHEDGSYSFYFSASAGKGRREIMRALPCCPRCHKRLPLGWNNPNIEDFYSISLLSSTGEGKTSFLLAMMERRWRRLGAISSNLYVYPAHIIDDDHDQYGSLVEQCEMMCKDQGECPSPTTPGQGKKINPVFLRIQYNGHNMILGIYDNSGEVLKAMNPGDDRIQMLLNMNAIIYFIDPSNMKVELPTETERQRKKRTDAILLDTVRKQGEFQKENRGTHVRGEELLREARKMVQSARRGRENPFALYQDFRNATMTAEGSEDMAVTDRNKRFMKRQHLCCVVIKSDLLQESPQMREIPHVTELFARDPEYNYLDEDIQYAREQIVQEVCSQFAFSRREMEIMEKDMKSVSWHCISSLGCGTEEIRKNVWQLKGRFDPIRVEEPLVICMSNRFRENGWEE